MKIAVCLSGQLRTGILAYENVKRYFGDLYPSCTFFAHTWNVNTRKPYTHIKEIYEPMPEIVDPADLEKYKNLYNIPDCNFKVEDFNATKFNYEHLLDKDNYPVWNPLYHSWVESLGLCNKYEQDSNIKFDLIIKLRPDMLYPAHRRLSSELLDIFLNYGQENFLVECLHDNWKDTEWMNDVVWISKPDTMRLAAKYFDRAINKEVKTLLLHLREHNINIINLDQTGGGYGILRKECLQYDPMTQYKECFDCEVHHFNPK